MRSKYSAAPWYTNFWVSNIIVYVLAYVGCDMLKIDPDVASRFISSAFGSVMCGLIPALLMPKLTLWNNGFVVNSIALVGGVLGVLTNLLVAVVAAFVLYAIVSVVLLRQHWQSSSILEP